jgi:hypothetical protein
MFNCPRGHNHDMEMKKETPESIIPDTSEDPALIATSSARAIAGLVRIYQDEYGMSRAHVFALYAVNLALFLLLDYGIFDISDPDCIALTSAFAVTTTRSILGQEVRAVFRRSIRKKTGDRESLWDQLPEGLKEILEDDSSSEEEYEGDHGHSDSDDVMSGASDEVTPTNPDETASTSSEQMSSGTNGEQILSKQRRSVPQQGPTGLCEMLCRYETMALGRDDHVTGKKE